MTKTLEQEGTPWGEYYTGSGRLTGNLTNQPPLCENGDVAPGWRWVGDLTMQEFQEEFERQEHDHCHSPSRADFLCPHCDRAGWNDSEPTYMAVRYFKYDWEEKDHVQYPGEDDLALLGITTFDKEAK